MDLDVPNISMGSLLRGVGDTGSPPSNPSSASPRQRSARLRRTSPLVRAAILRRATAGQRRAQADTSIEQFLRDQELAFDASTDSVDLNMSGSPTTRARSFLAHQRRSLSGDELATLLRELRTPRAAQSGRRRLSVGVSRRHLAALGNDGVQALLKLVDDGLEEFDGTLSASVEEDDTLTPSPPPHTGADADGEDRSDGQEEPHAGGEGDNTVMEESAGEVVDDGRKEAEEEEQNNDGAGVEGEPVEVNPEQAAEAMDGGHPKQAAHVERVVDEGEFVDVEGADDQETNAVANEGRRSGVDRSHLSRVSSNVPLQTPEVRTVTPRSPIRRTPSSATRRGTPSAGDGITPSGRRRSTQHSIPPGSGTGPLQQTDQHGTPVADRTASLKKGTPVTPASKTPLRGVRLRTSDGSRTPSSAVRSGGSVRRSSRGRPADTPSAGGSPSLRERSRRSRTPQSGVQHEAAAAGPPSEDVQAAGDAVRTDDEQYGADFDRPLPPALSSATPGGSTGRARSALVTPRSKATPRSGSMRKLGSVFERFFADGQQGQTSTPMSEPPRRAARAARASPHSKSLFMAAVPPQGRTPGRLSLAIDEDERPAPRFTSGLIDDPDEVGSDVSEEYPSEAGGAADSSRSHRSAGTAHLSQLSAGSRAAGTPFVPSAESTRLSLRPAGAPPPADAVDTAGDSSDAEIYPAAAAVASARSPAVATADRSGASAGTPTQRRSLLVSFADGTATGQEQPPLAAEVSQSQSKSKPVVRRQAAAGKLSAREAFARLFPTYEQDKEQRREEAAANRRRSPAARKPTKRSSLFGSHKTRRWFRQNAVGLRVTPEALREVDASVEKFERMVRGWLREVTGPRRAPKQSDVLAVLRRSGVAGTEPELRRLIRQHMMMEEQQQLIRVAEYGDRLFPADNPLLED